MNGLADLLESVFRPLLSALDSTGLFHTLRFAPLYRLAAALTALILVAYILSILLAPLQRRADRLKKVRIIGRMVALGLAVLMLWSIFRDVSFIQERGGSAASLIYSNPGFLIILAFAVFLEIRFSRWKRRG